MAENRLLYLSQADVVATGLSMAEIIDAVEAAFRAKGEGRTEMPPKPGVHPGGGNNFIHAMPAYIEDLKSAGVKWVSGFPENHKRGLPYITGLLIYNDVATGLPLAVMDCVWITAKRTGAASAIAARRLARPESSVMGMLGCGVQGRSHAEAFKVLFPIKKIMAYDQDPAVAARYAQDIGKSLGIEVVQVKSPREAVSGSDIVVTAGPILKVPHATLQAGWLDEGAFASLVDYDSYWSRDALAQAAAAAVGPGLGTDGSAEALLERVLAVPGPALVVDADALAARVLLRLRTEPVVSRSARAGGLPVSPLLLRRSSLSRR